MKIFDINVYRNVTSNTFVISNNTFKLFMLISDFATFPSSEKFKIDPHIRSQGVEQFKRIAQQTLEKLNFKRYQIKSLLDQLIKN